MHEATDCSTELRFVCEQGARRKDVLDIFVSLHLMV